MATKFSFPQQLFCKLFLLAALLMGPWAVVSADTLPDSITVKESARVLWDFESSLQGWTSQQSISNLAASAGCMRGSVTADPSFVTNPSPQQMSIKGSAGVAVRIWLSQAGPLQLSWENEDGSFSSSRTVSQNVPAQQWTTVRFDLSSNPDWAGKTISRISLSPGTTGTTFAIDYVALVDHLATPSASFVTKVFNFDAAQPDWTASSTVGNYVYQDGKLKGTSTGGSPTPSIVSPAISLTGQEGVVVQIKANYVGTLSLYWSSTDSPTFTGAQSTSISLTADPEWRIIKFDLRNNPKWVGKTITGLRIFPGASTNLNFEINSVLVVGNGAFEDTDGDLLDGFEELAYNTDPTQRTQLPGRFTYERWDGTLFDSTRQLVTDRAFYSKPDFVRWGAPASPVSFYQTFNFSLRGRGYITAPVSGYYRFWISGSSGMELYLSTDSTKYTKRKIAEINPELNTGNGILSTSTNYWDQYTNQMSDEIYLTQGSTYYMEFLQTTSHTANVHADIAWALPGAARTLLDMKQVVSYTPTADDLGDNYLPDAWETQYGLDPGDNGLVDIDRSGERADFDGDGLTNREEYLLGTNPANPDTYGNGRGDYYETQIAGTEGMTGSVPDATLLSSLNIQSNQGSDINWTYVGNGIIGDKFRGWIDWDFSVPNAGIWLLDLQTMLRGTVYNGDTVDLNVQIDGVDLGTWTRTYNPGSEDILRVITPNLTSGTHRVRFTINNMIARRTVEIMSLKVLFPSGPDLNGNGIADWVDALQLQSDHMINPPQSSNTSPVCLEGQALSVPGVLLNGQAVTLGADGHHWFRNLSLDATQPVAYTTSFANGNIQAGSITWTSTDVLSSPNLTIRLGDTLKLAANFTTGTGNTTIKVGSTNYTVGASGTVLYTFASKGTVTVTASRSGATSQSITVTVLGATFTNLPTLVQNSLKVLTLNKSSVDTALVLDPGDGLSLGDYVNTSSTQFSRTLYPTKTGRLAFVARVGAGGPIAAIAEFNTMTISGPTENVMSTTYASSQFQGYDVVTLPTVFTNLPTGARIVVTILRSGMTFQDGSTTATFLASDLANGILNLQFLVPQGTTGGLCHTITVYDASNRVIATY